MIDIANPAWAMTPEQVRFLLQVGVDHWHDYWEMERVDIPAPVASKRDVTEGMTSVYARTVTDLNELRKRTVSNLPATHAYRQFIQRKNRVDAESTPVRKLYAAILWEAVRNLYRDALHPFHGRQKKALWAFWWLNSLRFPVPPRVSANDLKLIASGRPSNLAPFKLAPDADVFAWLQTTPRQFCTGTLSAEPYLPWDTGEEHRRCLALTSFKGCCQILDLDPLWVRRAAHVVPFTPSRDDAADDADEGEDA